MVFLNSAINAVSNKDAASPIMREIYGNENAIILYSHYKELNPNLNELLQQVLYDTFWARSGLTLREKCLITIISLIALDKEQLLQVHTDAYIHLGATPEVVRQILDYMMIGEYVNPDNRAHSILSSFLNETSSQKNISSYAMQILSSRDQIIIDLAVHIALGDQEKTKICIEKLIDLNALTISEIQSIMLHQIMYCGFPCAMNGFAILKELNHEVRSENSLPPKKSEMMDALYGTVMSKAVYNRCQALSQDFNKLVQEIVYDVFWQRPGITLIQKSLVTIIVLIVLKKEEQLRIHLGGYFNLGGAPEVMVEILDYLINAGYIENGEKSSIILHDVVIERKMVLNKQAALKISEHEKAIIDLTASVAVGDNDKIMTSMKFALDQGLSASEIEGIMLHEMMYCGLPCVMQGFRFAPHPKPC